MTNFERDSVKEILLLAQQQDRTVIEFREVNDVIIAMDVTEDIAELEEMLADENK